MDKGEEERLRKEISLLSNLIAVQKAIGRQSSATSFSYRGRRKNPVYDGTSRYRYVRSDPLREGPGDKRHTRRQVDTEPSSRTNMLPPSSIQPKPSLSSSYLSGTTVSSRKQVRDSAASLMHQTGHMVSSTHHTGVTRSSTASPTDVTSSTHHTGDTTSSIGQTGHAMSSTHHSTVAVSSTSQTGDAMCLTYNTRATLSSVSQSLNVPALPSSKETTSSSQVQGGVLWSNVAQACSTRPCDPVESIRMSQCAATKYGIPSDSLCRPCDRAPTRKCTNTGDPVYQPVSATQFGDQADFVKMTRQIGTLEEVTAQDVRHTSDGQRKKGEAVGDCVPGHQPSDVAADSFVSLEKCGPRNVPSSYDTRQVRPPLVVSSSRTRHQMSSNTRYKLVNVPSARSTMSASGRDDGEKTDSRSVPVTQSTGRSGSLKPSLKVIGRYKMARRNSYRSHVHWSGAQSVGADEWLVPRLQSAHKSACPGRHRPTVCLPRRHQLKWHRKSSKRQTHHSDCEHDKNNIRHRWSHGAGPHSKLKLVLIGGILYSSNRRTLKKEPKVPTRSDCSLVVRKTSSYKPDHTLVGGFQYQLTNKGRSLQRVASGPSQGWSGPSRIHIGGTAYVRTSPGSLVRCDKHTSGSYASHAVNRSLTVARSTYRKSSIIGNYCMFYNRFGKCSRRASCPYIHDPDRITVCTRFLRGRCKVVDCPFSHKVSEDKVPSCAFFIKGHCSTNDCPYLHVSVGRAADVCPDFIQGGCPKGKQCKKQHTHMCPEHSKVGKCRNGRKCPLIHKQWKPKKRARVSRVSVSDESQTCNWSQSTGRLPSFIGLETFPPGVSDENKGNDTENSSFDQSLFLDSDLSIRPNFTD